MSGALEEREGEPSREEFRDVVAAGRPLMMRGAVRSWKAVGSWTPDSIGEKAGHRVVPVELYPGGSYYQSWLVFETTVRRYLELAAQSDAREKFYLAEVRIDELLPELWADVALPGCIDPRRMIFTAFFLGRDTISNLHYHATDQAMLCQVLGTKEVVLYPPEAFSHLSFHPWWNHRFNFSRLSFDGEGPPPSPQRQAMAIRCELQPGDALFIPMHWGHHVRGREWNASVTFFWRPRLREWRPGRTAVHARMGRSFRTIVSRPLASLCERVFGFRVIR